MGHQISLAYLTVSDVDPVTAVHIAAKAGYDLIGFRLLPASPAEAPFPLMNDEALLQDVLSALDDTGVSAADVEIARLKADTKIVDFESFLERSARLRARHVLVAGDDPERARLIESFGQFCRLCRGFSLTADLEFMPWTKVPNLAAARQVVEAAGEANGAVLVDALHLDRSGSSVGEFAALPRSMVNYVQLCDALADYDKSDEELIRVARTERMVPGEGDIDVVAIARAAPPDVTISIEVPNHQWAGQASAQARAKRVIDATREILAAAGRS
jgi:sugar phosphate isomerase/epimerase